MKRAWLAWVLFLVSVVLVLGAMVWSSRSVLKLEEAEKRARQQAVLKENVRLALWRMDSALAPIVAQENVRPYLAYRTSQGLERSPWVLLHFQFGLDGRLMSPQVAEARGARGEGSKGGDESARERLKELGALTTREALLAALPRESAGVGQIAVSEVPGPGQDRAVQEFNRRAQALSQNRMAMVQNQASNIGEPIPVAEMAGAVMRPLWIGDQLVLARRVAVRGGEVVQGCLLDWPAIRRSLLGEVRDLLPEAKLEPAGAPGPEAAGHTLAALPVRLVPGALPEAVGPRFGPAAWSLVAAWAAILVAAAAVGVLLAGAMRLSARRAAFVSAVTHELRTPLTTFQLYSEMLAEGMVPESEKQQYLRTLYSEAERLTHLVENVLAYARLERGRAGGNLEELTVGEFLGPVEPRLAEVAARAGMELVVEADEEGLDATVRVNRSSLEQILLNLVDNAAKYAGGAADKRIHLSARVASERVEMRVWDHGPGVSPQVMRRLFRAFARPADEAAGSAPGVGLGLALSRRLASDMGSRLELDGGFLGGACFCGDVE